MEPGNLTDAFSSNKLGEARYVRFAVHTVLKVLL